MHPVLMAQAYYYPRYLGNRQESHKFERCWIYKVRLRLILGNLVGS